MGTSNFKSNKRRSPDQRISCAARGFTLIEILVVATLMTMLALIAIPNYLAARKDAAKSSCINNIKQISYATEQWALENKKAPTTVVSFNDIDAYLNGAVVCPAGGKSFNDSYVVSIVANEPTCVRQPGDHYWLGSTTVAAIRTGTSSSTVNGLIDPGSASGTSGKGGKVIGKGGKK